MKYREWQLNPNSVNSQNIQLWSPDIMLTAKLRKEEAQQMVRDGRCFVITSQAIGFKEKN